MFKASLIKHEGIIRLGFIAITLILVCALSLCFGSARAEIVRSGRWGNLTWMLDNEDTLTIYGTGRMEEGSPMPWGTSIRHVVINNGITRIANNAFSQCTSLDSIIIPESVTYIGDSAFYACIGLSSITIPNGVTHIGDSAFAYCSKLTNINIPSSVVSIGDCAFCHCDCLSCINVATDNPNFCSIDDSLFDKDIKTLICYPPAKEGSFIIPDGVSSICNDAFSGCHGLIKIIIPNSVKQIGIRAFDGCTGLMAIDIPEGVTEIQDYAFIRCSELERVSLPKSLSSLGSVVFGYCPNLECIVLPDNISVIGSTCFLQSNAIRYTTIDSKTAETLSKAGFSFRSFGSNCDLIYSFINDNAPTLDIVGLDMDAETVIIPNGISTIDTSLFSQCTNLTKVSIPETVLSIGDSAFFNCTELKEVCILGDNISFGNDIFSGAPTIYCFEYSAIDFWAADNGYPIVYFGSTESEDHRTIDLPEHLHLPLGFSQELNPIVFPNDISEVIYTSSNSNIVSISGNIATAVNSGSAVVTATAGISTVTMVIEVYVPLESFRIEPDEVWMISKEQLQLKPQDIFPNDAEIDLIWSSSDIEKATVDSNGLVYAKRPGDTIIYARNKNLLTRECTIHICYPVDSVFLDPSDSILTVGQSLSLIACITSHDQILYNKLVSFESSDPFVATVDENGVVTAHNPGTTTVTATAASGVSASCNVTVREANTLTLPSGVTAIEAEAFMDNTSIEAVIIPDSCASIGERAFAGCANLVYVRIPAGLTDIAENAFEGCGNVRIERDGE